MAMTDFRKVVRDASPVRICRGILKAFLHAVGMSLNNLKETLELWYSGMKYDLAVTPQVWSLERMLNDEFDSIRRRIYIEEVRTVQGYYFFRAADPSYQKFYFGRAWFVDDTRYSSAMGFTVVLPEDIKPDDKMRALINRYKLASINYTITNR